MPWKESCVMDLKMQLIGDFLSQDFTITALSKKYEISRNTVYKWIRRYQEMGHEGLAEKDKAPRSHPNATSLEIARDIVGVKLAHRSWGPKKVICWLNHNHPETQWPAISTAGEILKGAGLVKPRRRKHRTPPYTEPFSACLRPNMVWSADYKGQFRTGDGKLCYPLTISDNFSRYILCCEALYHPTGADTKPVFEKVFEKYGLPEVIRTDNGSPFASVGLGGLTRLSVWFTKLGIKLERIKPGHPEENGRHERMHRSLKEATVKPPQANLHKQQQLFNLFIREYNTERPHEALGMCTPASYYTPSLRGYSKRLQPIIYNDNRIVRRVRHNGEIKWKGKLIYVSEALAQEPVALRRVSDHQWEVFFSLHYLGILNESERKIKSGNS